MGSYSNATRSIPFVHGKDRKCDHGDLIHNCVDPVLRDLGGYQWGGRCRLYVSQEDGHHWRTGPRDVGEDLRPEEITRNRRKSWLRVYSLVPCGSPSMRFSLYSLPRSSCGS